VERACRLALARPPEVSRLNRACGFVEERLAHYRSEGLKSEEARHKAVSDLCHVLLNSSEFVFVE